MNGLLPKSAASQLSAADGERAKDDCGSAAAETTLLMPPSLALIFKATFAKYCLRSRLGAKPAALSAQSRWFSIFRSRQTWTPRALFEST